MRRAAQVACVATALLFGAPRLAEAEPTPKERARTLYQKGDYAGALDALVHAQKLEPDPRLFWNMAACEKKLGLYAKAMAHVALYQSSVTGLTDAEANDAKQFLIAVRAYVALVTVDANVEGTRVFVDDELLGTTPLSTPAAVDDGDHAVRFVHDGYRTVDRTEHVRAGTDLRWVVKLDSNAEKVVPPPVERSPSRIGPLVLGGAGAAIAVTGGVLGLVTASDASDIRDACGTSCPPSRWEKYRTTQTIGDGMLVAGAAALAASVVWWVLQPSSSNSARAFFPSAIGGVF